MIELYEIASADYKLPGYLCSPIHPQIDLCIDSRMVDLRMGPPDGLPNNGKRGVGGRVGERVGERKGGRKEVTKGRKQSEPWGRGRRA